MRLTPLLAALSLLLPATAGAQDGPRLGRGEARGLMVDAGKEMGRPFGSGGSAYVKVRALRRMSRDRFAANVTVRAPRAAFRVTIRIVERRRVYVYRAADLKAL